MIVESTMLIVGDNEKRVLPPWAKHKSVDEMSNQELTLGYQGRWMVIIRLGFAGSKINEIGVNPGYRGKSSGLGMIQEALWIGWGTLVEEEEFIGVANPVLAVY